MNRDHRKRPTAGVLGIFYSANLAAYATLSQKRRRGATDQARAFPQAAIHFFERTEKTGEGIFKMLGATTQRMKIAASELSGDGDHRRAHRAVFLRALRPGDAVRFIQP